MVTLEQLLKIMPYAGRQRGIVFLAPLNDAMSAHGINTPLRCAAFLANIAHESGSLHYTRELASGARYEGRKDLGNTQPGDGTRFRGRGLIQVTGRANYLACGNALGLPLIDQPELLEQPTHACMSAVWFWTTRGLNKLADVPDFDGVCDVINRGRKTVAVGDSNGWSERRDYYGTALKVLA